MLKKHYRSASVQGTSDTPFSPSLSSQVNPQLKQRSSSIQNSFTTTKLPLIKIRKVMKKIGAAQKNDKSFIPSDQQRLAFRKAKWKQLREQYTSRKGKKHPFDYELDEIVLDCWEYGEDFGRNTIWKKYKQKFDQLTFDTLKVVHGKKL